MALSTDNGATWTAPAVLNTNAGGDSGGDDSPQVTTDGLGNWVAVWFSNDDLGGTIGTDFDILVARFQIIKEDIPTISEWGLVAMTLLVLTAGTLVLARRKPTHA